MVEVDLLDHFTGSSGVEEEAGVAGSNTENSGVGVVDSGGGQFARGDVSFGLETGDCALSSEIPPANSFVFAGGGEDVVVDIPDNRFDAAVVFAHANLMALRGGAWRDSRVAVAIGLLSRSGCASTTGQIEDFQLLVLGTSDDALRVVLDGKGDRADNVVVRQDM